jgi:hypothetical protein
MPYLGKRVFSNNQDTTFRDYLTHKKGVEIMKQMKSTTNANKVNFLSYNDFMTLTKTFSKNSNILATDVQMKISVDDKTVGLIYYEKIISHLKDCPVCKNNNNKNHTNVVNPINLLECNSIKNIIYAYENHFSNKSKNIYQKGIDLDRWCKKCDSSYPQLKEDDYFAENDEPIQYESPEKCKCPQDKIRNPGRGRKPIFCSYCDKFVDICLCPNRWGRVDAIRHVNRKSEAETFEDRNKKDLFV